MVSSTLLVGSILLFAVLFPSQAANLLRGRVACVTGASRGIGRGISIALAEQGATVYATGRSIDNKSVTEKDLGGTLQSLAEEKSVSEGGGRIIPVQVDHRDDQAVEVLFKRIAEESQRLDILVNNAFQLPKDPTGTLSDTEFLSRDFWEQPGAFYDSLMDVGLRSHYTASVYAYPLLKQTAMQESSEKPLIVHVSSFGGVTYSFNVAYGVAKAAVDRMAKDMHVELRRHDIRCISVYPGIVRTERMNDFLVSGEFERRMQLATPERFVESPQLSGEAIAALFSAGDGYLDKVSGKVVVTAEVAKKYGLKDRWTNHTPPSIRSLKYLIPALIFSKQSPEVRRRYEDLVISLSPDILLPMSVMASPRPK
eukprot:gene39088-47554_t